MSVSDSNFFNHKFANLGLMTCYIPKNVSTFHWKEDRNFGFCWYLLLRGNISLQSKQFGKFMVEEVRVRNRQYWNILFLSQCKSAIFGGQFVKNCHVWHIEIKMYEVWVVKMPLNINFDWKIVLFELLTLFQSIRKTLYT